RKSPTGRSLCALGWLGSRCVTCGLPPTELANGAAIQTWFSILSCLRPSSLPRGGAGTRAGQGGCGEVARVDSEQRGGVSQAPGLLLVPPPSRAHAGSDTRAPARVCG